MSVTLADKHSEKQTKTKVSFETTCPLGPETDSMGAQQCHTLCEWHDGQECAIWRMIKSLDKVAENAGRVVEIFAKD